MEQTAPTDGSVSAIVTPARRRFRLTYMQKRNLWGFLFAVPALVFFALFAIYPIAPIAACSARIRARMAGTVTSCSSMAGRQRPVPPGICAWKGARYFATRWA